MMQGELFRYARRGLTNALNESSNNEFKQLVLMIKMTEAGLISKLESKANEGTVRKEVDRQTEALEARMTQRFDQVDRKLEELLVTLRQSFGSRGGQDGKDEGPSVGDISVIDGAAAAAAGRADGAEASDSDRVQTADVAAAVCVGPDGAAGGQGDLDVLENDLLKSLATPGVYVQFNFQLMMLRAFPR